jgi:hypothetical protein
MVVNTILDQGVRRNLAELYVGSLIEKLVDNYHGYYLLRVLYETGQQGNFLFDPNFNLVSEEYAKPDLKAENPIEFSAYKVDRVGREILPHLDELGIDMQDKLRSKVIQKIMQK